MTCPDAANLLDIQTGAVVIASATAGSTATATLLSSLKAAKTARTDQVAQLKAEYEYVYARYVCAINAYLAATTTDAKATAKTPVVTLNGRLIAILKVYEALLEESDTHIDELVAGISELQGQQEVLAATSGDEALYRKMIEYTKEKAAMSSNLLNLYAFLNIVGIGMLFYIYRAT